MLRIISIAGMGLALVAGCASKSKSAGVVRTPHVASSELGDLHHPVSTKSSTAQKKFNEGLTLVYAFNHDEAIKSFETALAADPNLAMGHWGIALALGPNYNIDVDAEREKKAYEHIQKAKELSKDAPQQERDLIDALAKRFSNDDKPDLKKLNVEYSKAMRELMKKYPDDLDVATLFADSAMVLRPWQLWSHDGKPAEGTEELVAVLESVLKRNPDHIGANHLYIHAIEASLEPEKALDSAARLGGLAPGAGHLVHMPSHVYSRVGDYEAAAGSNEAAVDADREYIKDKNPQGFYPMMYYPHNMHFLAFAHAMQGRYADAKKSADELAAHVAPHVQHMPMLEGFMPTTEIVLARFRKWDEILVLKQPDQSMPVATAIWHCMRGLAFARTGKIEDAEREKAAMLAIVKALPADSMFGPLNKSSDVFAIATNTLDGEIALAKGDKKLAVEKLLASAEGTDKLNYTEPPDWWLPARETVGAILISEGKFGDAEKIFRKELDYNPRSGRALFGLMISLQKQNNDYAAKLVEEEYRTSWKNADVKLELSDL